MVRVRFYLLCLKGEAYLYARLGEATKGIALLHKVIEMDSRDVLGATALLAVISAHAPADPVATAKG